jgi:CheY-like chemotaxis protein
MEHKSILLVEDDYLDIIQVQRVLDKMNANYTLHTSFNGKDALQLLRGYGPEQLKKVPDLILVDINMPKMNGLEFLERIKQERQWKDIPVFIMSTSLEDEERAAAAALGAKGYIAKPLNFDTYGNRATSLDTFNLLLELLR